MNGSIFKLAKRCIDPTFRLTTSHLLYSDVARVSGSFASFLSPRIHSKGVRVLWWMIQTSVRPPGGTEEGGRDLWGILSPCQGVMSWDGLLPNARRSKTKPYVFCLKVPPPGPSWWGGGSVSLCVCLSGFLSDVEPKRRACGGKGMAVAAPLRSGRSSWAS